MWTPTYPWFHYMWWCCTLHRFFIKLCNSVTVAFCHKSLSFYAFLLAEFLTKLCVMRLISSDALSKKNKILIRRMEKPTLRLVLPTKTKISLRFPAAWSDSSLTACAFDSLQTIKREIHVNKCSCHTRWMYRLIWVIAGHTGLIVGFVVRWLNKWSYPGNATITKQSLPEASKEEEISNKQWQNTVSRKHTYIIFNPLNPTFI